MSSGQSAPGPPPLNATRQMLDELDALMAQMLALPINDAEEVAAPAAGSPAKSRPLAATLTLLQVPAGAPPLDAAHTATNPSHIPILGVLNAAATAEPAPTAILPLARSPKPLAYPPLPLLSRPAAAEPLSDRVVPPAPEPDLQTLLANVADPPDTLARWFILPLLWGNRVYDRGTAFLGEPGVWLRGPTGRGTVGTTGLVLFAAALAWLLRDWLGWTW